MSKKPSSPPVERLNLSKATGAATVSKLVKLTIVDNHILLDVGYTPFAVRSKII